jgi:predicted NBD/HSP70 family sugar kinase
MKTRIEVMKEAGLDPELIARYERNLEQARSVFETSISKVIIYLATVQNISFPDKVGGHSNMRGKDVVSGQIGSGKSASDHGINQANKWLEFVALIDQSTEKKAKAEEFLRRLDKIDKDSEEISKPQKQSGREHSPNTRKRVAEEKVEDKKLNAIKKRRKWEKENSSKLSTSFVEKLNMERMKEVNLGSPTGSGKFKN